MNVLLTYSRGLLFPFLVSYGTASLSLWSWESLFFSGSVDKKKKWIVADDHVFMQCPSLGVNPGMPGGYCMDCWKLARKDSKPSRCIPIFFKKSYSSGVFFEPDTILDLLPRACTALTAQGRGPEFRVLTAKQAMHTHCRPCQQQKSIAGHSVLHRLLQRKNKRGARERHPQDVVINAAF